jgi:phosphoglycolate phosphatase
MLKHILFDFDGTIADSEQVCFQLIQDLAAKHGYRVISRAELAELKVLSYPERLQYLGLPMYRIPFVAMEARRCYRALQDSLTPFAGLAAALHRLRKRGCTLHVLSSNAVSNIRHFLDRNNLDVFETISCERSFFGKHVGLRRFLRTHGLLESEIVYVADEIRDVDACRKIGVQVVSAGWGFDLLERLEAANPGMVATDPMQAVELIESLTLSSVRDITPVLAATADVALAP